MATQDHTSFHGGSNAANSELEQLKRQLLLLHLAFKKATRQYVILSERVIQFNATDDNNERFEHLSWRYSLHYGIAHRAHQRILALTAPAGGAE